MTNEDWTTVISYDPGKITGVAEGVFSETEPLVITDKIAIPYEDLRDGFPLLLSSDYDIVISEQFTNRTNNDFAADLVGVRVEGILDLAYRGDVVWRDRTKKDQVKDSTLQEHGLWVTGSEVDWEDGRDVNDAIIHMLAHVAFTLQHRPTLRKYFK